MECESRRIYPIEKERGGGSSRKIPCCSILDMYDCSRHRFLGTRHRGAVYATTGTTALYFHPGPKVVLCFGMSMVKVSEVKKDPSHEDH